MRQQQRQTANVIEGDSRTWEMGVDHTKMQVARLLRSDPEGWIKVNVDGSFLEHAGEAGVGATAIARNSDGQVIFLAWRRFYERGASAAEAEALACVEGLRWAVLSNGALPQGLVWASRCPLNGPRVYCQSSPLTRGVWPL